MMDDNGPATKKAKADDVAITKAKQAWTDFLRDGHNLTAETTCVHGPRGESTLWTHLHSVLDSLAVNHGAGEDLQAIGLFHSIYGTEGFQGHTLEFERRGSLRDVIGLHAERVVFANCVMDRKSLDEIIASTGPADSIPADKKFQLGTRPEFNDDPLVPAVLELGKDDLLDLLRVHLADMIDLVAAYRMWYYRNDAYKQIAATLTGTYQAAHTACWDSKPADATPDNCFLPDMVAARKEGHFDDIKSGKMSYDELLDHHKGQSGHGVEKG